MHAAVLTFILMAGTSGDPTGGNYAGSMNMQEPGNGGGECANCDGGHGGHHGKGGDDALGGCFDDMPQSCYNPAYGCYPGGERRINRYPAFHGSYYRKPSNYRNLFDYPWHAGLHEPTSLFSYNVINAKDDEKPKTVKAGQ
jgi:hypothetical protein